MIKKIKNYIDIHHLIEITITGTVLWFAGMFVSAAVVAVLPFSFFVDIHESKYLDQESPVPELLFLSNRTALFNISAGAIREIQRVEDNVVIQHPEVIITKFNYETSNNKKDLLISLPFKEFPIVEKGLYSVSGTVTLDIPVGLLTIKKSHTFNNKTFTVS